MRVHWGLTRLLGVALCVVLGAACARSGTPPPALTIPAAEAVRQSTPNLAATAVPAATATPSPAPQAGATAAPPCPPVAQALPVTHFVPITEAAEAIAYSAEGLCLTLPATGATVSLHHIPPGAGVTDSGYAWSPDGWRIAFWQSLASPASDCWQGHLMLADLERGVLQALLEAPAAYSRLAWSPDGERLAFVQLSNAGAGDLLVLHIPSGELSRLGRNAAGPQWQAPAWLDDWHVAYLRDKAGSQPVADLPKAEVELVSQPLDGSAPHVILPPEETRSLRVWALSPERRQVAYNWGPEIMLAEVETGRARSIGQMADTHLLQWSPDGQRLLGGYGLGELFLTGPAGPVQAIDLGGTPAQPQAWSPDGQRFAVLLGGGSRLAVYDLEGGALSYVPAAVSAPWEVAWSPRRAEPPSAADMPPVGVSRLERVADLCCPRSYAPDGQAYLALSQGLLSVHARGDTRTWQRLQRLAHAAWTPDGRAVVYVDWSDGPPYEVGVLDPASDRIRAIGSTYIPHQVPFDARGRAVLATRDRFQAVDLASGEATELPLIGSRGWDLERPTRLAFSADGRHVAALEADSSSWEVGRLSIVDLEARARAVLTDRVALGPWSQFAWSGDGARLAYCTLPEDGGEPELWVAGADGSGARRVVVQPEGWGGRLAGVAWLPGTPYIVYQYVPHSNAPTQHSEYRVVSADGGAPKTLFTSGLGLTLSPDGHIISFSRDIPGSEETGSWIALLSF